jgi:hypothetical protein
MNLDQRMKSKDFESLGKAAGVMESMVHLPSEAVGNSPV